MISEVCKLLIAFSLQMRAVSAEKPPDVPLFRAVRESFVASYGCGGGRGSGRGGYSGACACVARSLTEQRQVLEHAGHAHLWPVGAVRARSGWLLAPRVCGSHVHTHVHTRACSYAVNNTLSFRLFAIADGASVNLFKASQSIISALQLYVFLSRPISPLQWQTVVLQGAFQRASCAGVVASVTLQAQCLAS